MSLITINLPCFGFTISHEEGDKGGASIESNLHDRDVADDHPFNAGVDGIESLVLGHFCGGIDVESPAYIEGIETAAMALGQEYSDD